MREQRPSRRLKRRAVAAALLVGVVAIPALAGDDDPRTVNRPGAQWNGWQTQDWPQGGQQADQRRRITEDFTNAMYQPPTGAPTYPGPFELWGGQGSEFCALAPEPVALPGPVTRTTFFGGILWCLSSPSVMPGEVATGVTPGTASSGPQSVGFALEDFTGLPTLIAFTTLGAGLPYNGINFMGFSACDGSRCDVPVGTPVVASTPVGAITVGLTTYGYLDVYAAANKCTGDVAGLWWHSVRTEFTKSGMTATMASVENPDRRKGCFPIKRFFEERTSCKFGPTLDSGVLYLAAERKCKDCGNYVPGNLRAVRKDAIDADLWVVPLQTGSGSNVPLPKGQEPPPPEERYHPTTPVTVSGNLCVVGVVKYSDNDDSAQGYGIMGFNTRDGCQRWIYKTDARVLPTPAIVSDLIIFGTANGRVYALVEGANAGGWTTAGGAQAWVSSPPSTSCAVPINVRWATSYSSRLRYRRTPFNASEAIADVALYGPAISQDRSYACFGGSDGRVHQFAIGSGAVQSSQTLAYHLSRRSWGVEYDANGAQIYRPLTIDAPPAIYKNRMLVVKAHTLNLGIGRSVMDENGSFLFAVRLPDLTFDPDIRGDAAVTLAPGNATFRAAGRQYGGCSMNGNGGSLNSYDIIRRVTYIDDPGWGYALYDTCCDPWGPIDDAGGVSFGSGFLLATDRGGHTVLIPSADEYKIPFPGGGGSLPPVPPTLVLPPLPPIEAGPNPFNPGKALGGAFKFRNLPSGTTVEIFTLAYERVRAIAESDHQALWDATNEAGQAVATGVYLYRIVTPDHKPPVTGRIALVR